MIGKSDEAEEVINIADIYYFEIVDRKCFAYLRSGVFNVELNLQAILERFRDDGFLRTSKSMVVNVFKLVQIKSDINMKVHALLENGETVIVNRSYKRSFYSSMKALLKMEEQYETNS